jgi:dihydrodipicolinate synthase/N-acetylneuraminate lyase
MASFIYACPEYMMKWWRAISSGNLPEALRMQHEVNDLLQQVVLPPILNGYSEVSGTKAFVEALGHFACGPSRQPFFPVPREIIARQRREVAEKFPQFLK